MSHASLSDDLWGQFWLAGAAAVPQPVPALHPQPTPKRAALGDEKV